jgi:phosphoribosylanthranilate isomerase
VASLWIKICGVTRPEDAEAAFGFGADAVGLNFVPSSPRFLSLGRAKTLVSFVLRPGEWVGVFADASLEEMRRVHGELGLSRVQLHGHESPEVLLGLAELGVVAYQALRIGSKQDVEGAAAYGGDRILVDAKVEGQLGGTGQRPDLELIRPLAAARRVVLAGGLTPDSVASAVQAARPFGVDTASGVEHSPGVKDPQKVRDFVDRARKASA